MMPALELAARLLEIRKWSDRQSRLVEHLPASWLFANEARLDDLGLSLDDIAEAQRQRRTRRY